MSSPLLEQHWTRSEAAKRALAPFDLAGRRVVELGSGTGVLTQALLDAGVSGVTAWEIDPALQGPNDPRVIWRTGDIFQLTQEDLSGDALVAFAPYEALDRIAALLGDQDAILLIPEKRLEHWVRLGFRATLALSGVDFEPPAKGSHWVIARGF